MIITNILLGIIVMGMVLSALGVIFKSFGISFEIMYKPFKTVYKKIRNKRSPETIAKINAKKSVRFEKILLKKANKLGMEVEVLRAQFLNLKAVKEQKDSAAKTEKELKSLFKNS